MQIPEIPSAETIFAIQIGQKEMRTKFFTLALSLHWCASFTDERVCPSLTLEFNNSQLIWFTGLVCVQRQFPALGIKGLIHPSN